MSGEYRSIILLPEQLVFLTMLLVISFGCSKQADQDSESKPAADSGLISSEPEKSDSPKTKGQIVFSSNRSNSWRIWIMSSDGSGLRQLTRGQPEDHDVDPVFHPGGKTILFSSNRGGKNGIWQMPIQNPDQIESICEGNQAEWSSDGRKIVFQREGKIIIRELADGVEKVISPESWSHCSGPAWSPDGRTIAFACRWEAGNAVFTVPTQGGTPKKVYDKKGACEPHWSPDGSKLVYEAETHICTIQPDGKKNRLITYFGGVQRYPRFNPDGEKLIYCQGVSENGPWELYTIGVQGGTPTKFLDGGSDMNPDWK